MENPSLSEKTFIASLKLFFEKSKNVKKEAEETLQSMFEYIFVLFVIYLAWFVTWSKNTFLFLLLIMER